MVKAIEITKVSIRDRLVVDADVRMLDPQDFDFSPRASIDGSTLSLRNEGDEEAATNFELDSDQMTTAERDRMLELRVKFSVEGMHGVLTHKTKNTRIAPNAKKLAEPRWKTLLPLVL
ncbi:MAG: hypothetical protein VX652_01235 [Candidatus Thermoplasmatota archaeon]|uniref:Uncharacterized protein n=1 Tax=uncultured marine group II/III euryarchaeote AD1000_87_H07 TaxID=1457819 RepID=A0A075G4P2_9EURY|nr:hypothetical protein [uncultured marine group II/III euryarchaeote AD1000_87_H07]MAS88488.1 hypothetical protein [Euryarchaeota archaeon]MEC7700403.1 hypothetical protein [Candidatus Thermoplasmatota archaeon]MBM67099.1 hypothetical protein [Euryarchaeota archaeon]MEE3114117.1 hypothetical protein [Candidatus Thermoplasmatota archaeon]